jgi:hypothetical protein
MDCRSVLLHAGADGAGTSLDVKGKFCSLLKSTFKPDVKVLREIANKYPSHMMACFDKESAATLYETVKGMPHTSTKAHFIHQHGLHINGPWCVFLCCN